MRASETVSEASPGSTASQTGVPTQVVQQVQGTQQRLLVQTSVQAKPGHVSPLQLTNIPVPQQVRLPPALPPASRTNPCSLLGSALSIIKDMGHLQRLPHLLTRPVRPCPSGPTGEGVVAQAS